MKVFKVTYTKKTKGNGSINVKAINEESALKVANNLCFTGSKFRNAIEIDANLYEKPRKQGFQGVN